MSGFTIFLALLRTIGILGLWLLAAAFLFLLLILFVPVRYRAEGSIDDREGGESFDPERAKKASRGELHISWLLHFLRIRISFPGAPAMSVKILFFRIPVGKKRQKEQKEHVGETEKKGGHTRPDTGRLIELLGNDETKRAIHAILNKSGKLLRYLLPKKWKVEGSAGFGGPEGTGKFMEAEGLLFPLICGHVWVTPDFDRYRAELVFSAKGSIRLIRVLVTALLLIADRNVRRLIHTWKNL